MGVSLLLIVAGFGAGVFGSLLGLGGGILIVPLLTLGFGLPVREAVGVSLVSVIVTSSAAAGVYLERHVANLRLGMTLELFTAFGALVGGLVAFLISEQVLAGLFTVLLLYTAATMVRSQEAGTPSKAADDGAPGSEAEGPADAAAATKPDAGPVSKPDAGPVTNAGPASKPNARQRSTPPAIPPYTIHNYPLGVVGALFAGVVSALLGIGGGIVKVPVMHLAMGVPLRVATATSNLMIGVTASASAIIYLVRGGIDPLVAGPTAVGVFLGATLGSRTVQRVDVRVLRILFVVVLLFTAWQMAGRALS